jgi:SNF2 family DNA or RNA helicase
MKLYQHQIECVEKVGWDAYTKNTAMATSRLIADDMGLGKTYEGIAVDNDLRKDKYAYRRPTLIIAPSGTHVDWTDSIMEYNDHWHKEDRNTLIRVIDRKNRQLFVNALKDWETWRSDPGIMTSCYFIMHYEGLRLIPELRDVQWFHIICDEVHRIKNRASQQTRALKALDTKYKTGLSGTPADDKPQDIWSILNWLWPKTYRSYWKFVKETCVFEDPDLQKIKYGRTFKKIEGVNPDGAKQMLSTISPYYVRRKKGDVGIDLPPKTYSTRYVDLGTAQRRTYDEMRKDMLAWMGEQREVPFVATAVISQLVRLQQMALATPVVTPDGHVREMTSPSAKLEMLEEIVDGNPNEPLVVFSQSRSMVELVVRTLRSRSIEARLYTGSVSQSDRNVTVQKFQAGDIQVLAGTIAAGGEGITLHRASTAIFLDRAWNPTRNRQAEDRLHRIGQVNPVQIIDFIARNTVDLGRRQRIANKWSQLALILGDNVEEEQYLAS